MKPLMIYWQRCWAKGEAGLLMDYKKPYLKYSFGIVLFFMMASCSSDDTYMEVAGLSEFIENNKNTNSCTWHPLNHKSNNDPEQLYFSYLCAPDTDKGASILNTIYRIKVHKDEPLPKALLDALKNKHFGFEKGGIYEPAH